MMWHLISLFEHQKNTIFIDRSTKSSHIDNITINATLYSSYVDMDFIVFYNFSSCSDSVQEININANFDAIVHDVKFEEVKIENHTRYYEGERYYIKSDKNEFTLKYKVKYPVEIRQDTETKNFYSEFVFPIKYLPDYDVNIVYKPSFFLSINSNNYTIKVFDYENYVFREFDQTPFTKYPESNFRFIYTPTYQSYYSIHNKKQVTRFLIKPQDLPKFKKINKSEKAIFLISHTATNWPYLIYHYRRSYNVGIYSLPKDFQTNIFCYGKSIKQYNRNWIKINDTQMMQMGKYEVLATLGIDNIYYALKKTMTQNPNHIFIVASDNPINMEEAISLAKRTKSKIHVLGVGSRTNISFFRQLSALTGGVSKFVDDADMVEFRFADVMSTFLQSALHKVKITSDCGKLIKPVPEFLPSDMVSVIDFMGDVNKKCQLKIDGIDSNGKVFKKTFKATKGPDSLFDHVSNINYFYDYEKAPIVEHFKEGTLTVETGPAIFPPRVLRHSHMCHRVIRNMNSDGSFRGGDQIFNGIFNATMPQNLTERCTFGATALRSCGSSFKMAADKAMRKLISLVGKEKAENDVKKLYSHLVKQHGNPEI